MARCSAAAAVLIFIFCFLFLYIITAAGLACARTNKRKILIQVFQETASTLNENNIPFVIFWGTLLGAVRGGEIIRDDDDADFVILGRDNHKRALDVLRKKYGENRVVGTQFFADAKGLFKLIHTDVQMAARDNPGSPWVRQDITPHVGVMSSDTDVKREAITMHGMTVYKPPNAHTLLQELYGDDYMTPIAYKKTEGDPRHKVMELKIRRAFKQVGLYI